MRDNLDYCVWGLVVIWVRDKKTKMEMGLNERGPYQHVKLAGYSVIKWQLELKRNG